MALPLPIFQLVMSDSDNTRHITPCYIPLAVAVAIAAGATGVLTSRWSWAVFIAVAFGSTRQIRNDFLPLAVWKSDVWDWEPLHAASAERHIEFPRLAYLGNGLHFNQAFIMRRGFSAMSGLMRSGCGEAIKTPRQSIGIS